MRVGNAEVSNGQTQVQVPVDLLDASDAQPIGLLSMAVQYDATRVKAITCNVGSSFDLLLCNLAKPGLIQLAGGNADGIRANVRIADMTFEILQPSDLFVPLTAQLKRVSNREGDALSASGQDGQIGSSCIAGGSNCHNVYLPLVQK